MISYINTDYLKVNKNRFIQSIWLNKKILRLVDSDLKIKTGDQDLFLFRVGTGSDQKRKYVNNFLTNSREIII